MRSPAAVAEIKLSEEERLRIAKELGLDESQLDAVPKKLDIARFDFEEGEGLDDDEDEVSGFQFNPGAMSFDLAKFGVADRFQPSLQVGKIPGGILIPV